MTSHPPSPLATLHRALAAARLHLAVHARALAIGDYTEAAIELDRARAYLFAMQGIVQEQAHKQRLEALADARTERRSRAARSGRPGGTRRP